jgi:transcriptional regulator with XRE-family HTH domain
MDDPESFGSWLRVRRRARDLSRADLARRVSCAVITIKKIETGERRPSRQIAELILDVLAVPADERTALVRLARTTPAPAGSPPRAPALTPADLALDDLSGRVIRNYTLHERLGAGGFGVVYRAEQPEIGRAVAIKIILPQYANLPEFIRRFEAEAQIIARLEHPHIIPLYDYWREPGGTHLVMRYVAGGTLHAILERGPLSLDTVARVLEQVGAALAVAHRAGIVHRDLKPSNILMDSDGNAYLADFGIAKDVGNAEANDQTQAGMILGSPAYLSPEQIRDEPVTPLSDIYSLGIMLYELLTSAKPFQARTPAELLQKHINEALPPLRARRADLPEALEALIQRATAKNPADRYPDVSTLMADFRRTIVPHGAAMPAAVPEGAVVGRAASEYATVLLELPELINPYKGLRSFTQADAAHFFGRETLVAQLLERLAEEFFSQKAPGPLAGDDGRETVENQQPTTPRFLAVVGPSGSGKSSVVRAGLIPALRRGGVPGSEHWFVAELLPGAHPLEELELALLRVAADSTRNLAEQLGRDKRGLLRAARLVLPPDDKSELLLVIDQFEELFTLVEDEAVRLHLLDSLVAAVCDERSRVRVVITLRADFMDRPLQYGDFGDLLRRQAEFVLPLMPDELERAIVGPAECAGLTLDPGLLAAIVRDVGEQPGTLPLVQYTLTELFEQREGRMLTLNAYQASGGVTGALARRAEEIYAGLTKQQQEAARQLFLRLISLGEGVEDTRRRVRRAELATTNQRSAASDGVEAEPSSVVGGQSSAIDSVIDLYGRYRLLTFDRDPITRGPTVEIAHEALIRNWERLRDWLEASRDDLRVQRRLMAAAAEWANAGCDASFLASGARLAQFAALAATGDLTLNETETAYVHASVAERERQEATERDRQARELGLQRRAANRLRYLVAALALFLVGAIGLTTFAFNQRNVAERTARLASARELAASAISSLNRDPESSILLALQAVTTTYAVDQTVLPEAEQALHRAVQASHVRLSFADETYAMMAVAFSPDGTRLATIDDDGVVKVRDATTGNMLLTLTGHTSGNVSPGFQPLAFSPDGTRLATCIYGSVTVWNAASGQALLTISNNGDEVWSIVFSRDGRRLVTGGGSGMVKLWDASTGEELLTLSGHTDVITGLAFSPNGTRLATGSMDKIVRIWDVATGKVLITLSSNSYVNSIAFSPDGTRLAVSSGETALSIWDAFSGKLLNQLTSLEPEAVAFSPDGARYSGPRNLHSQAARVR